MINGLRNEDANCQEEARDRFRQNLLLFNIDSREPDKHSFDDYFLDETYTELKAVAYVASPTFFCRHSSHFEDVEMVMGINDSELCSSVTRGIMRNWEFSGIDFFNDCDEDTKDRISCEKVRLYYSKPGTIVHSKFYLMHGNNKDHEEYLVIGGSCNMTENGFGIGARQYEEAWISKDKTVYDAYLMRYNSIREYTMDAVPEGCRKLWKEKRRIADISEEADIKTDYLDENRDSMAVTTDMIRNLSALSRSTFDDKKRAERVVELMKSSTNNAKNKVRVIKARNDLQNNRQEFVKLRVEKVGESEKDIALRMELTYHADDSTLYSHRPGIDNDAIRFNNKLSGEEIREEISKLIEFTRCYERNVSDKNSSVGRKIWEVFLHAYQSPFFWKYRQGMKEEFHGTDEMLSKVPNILFISGQSSSGKTPLLSAINQLLQDGAFKIPEWKKYKEYDGKSFMDSRLKENNLFPVIIDEVEKEFLSGRNCKWYGEAWIKMVANGLGASPRPYMIMASNKNIELTSPLQTRINYISIDEKITLSAEERQKLSDIINSMNNRLFMDFCDRALNQERFYQVRYDSKFLPDFAGPARDIFLGYFEELGMDIPDNFPVTPINDYAIKGVQMWRDVYLDKTIQEAFTYVEEDNELKVNRELLSNKQYSKKEKDLMRFLNETVKKSGNANENTYLHLDATAFFEWIGMENPYSIKQVEADPEPKKTGKVLWIFNNLFHRKDMGAKKGYGI